nr:LEAF RUST 10 DISEASE-RESISTANCE LOCUS RECEPTOR-LIKE PROTEIN KINASE-like 1.1 [Ipomoea batatas]
MCLRRFSTYPFKFRNLCCLVKQERKLRIFEIKSSDPASALEIGRSRLFGILVFSYSDLEEATSNFDTSKELGDGAFGTVYYGIVGDGREVVVKCLHERKAEKQPF